MGPTVKQLWNYALRVLYIFWGLNINTTAFCQYSEPTLKKKVANGIPRPFDVTYKEFCYQNSTCFRTKLKCWGIVSMIIDVILR